MLTVSPATARNWNVPLSPTSARLRGRVCPQVIASPQFEAVF